MISAHDAIKVRFLRARAHLRLAECRLRTVPDDGWRDAVTAWVLARDEMAEARGEWREVLVEESEKARMRA